MVDWSVSGDSESVSVTKTGRHISFTPGATGTYTVEVQGFSSAGTYRNTMYLSLDVVAVGATGGS
jgi:hypothetical protein